MTKIKEKQNRIGYIDLFRAAGIILMIVGHVDFGAKADTFVHAFHMPMFFFVDNQRLLPFRLPWALDAAFVGIGLYLCVNQICIYAIEGMMVLAGIKITYVIKGVILSGTIVILSGIDLLVRKTKLKFIVGD